MSHTIVHHLNAHRIPGEALDHSEADRFLLESTYTESNLFNADGTKKWQHAILAHGVREDVEDKIEDVIDTGVVSYRSRNRGPDYFRSGVQNALDDADRLTDATAKRIRVRIGCGVEGKDEDESSAGTAQVRSIIDGEPWEEYEPEFDRPSVVTRQAFVTVDVMDAVARVSALLDSDREVDAFRNFEILEPIAR